MFGVVSGAELTGDSSCCGIVAGELGWSWPCQRNMCCRAEDEPKKIEDSSTQYFDLYIQDNATQDNLTSGRRVTAF